ncbi:MAG: hypothetical protein QM571_03315 [Micrococcaceae bacterium]
MGRMVARNYRTTQQPITGDVVYRLGSSENTGTTVSAEALWECEITNTRFYPVSNYRKGKLERLK